MEAAGAGVFVEIDVAGPAIVLAVVAALARSVAAGELGGLARGEVVVDFEGLEHERARGPPSLRVARGEEVELPRAGAELGSRVVGAVEGGRLGADGGLARRVARDGEAGGLEERCLLYTSDAADE